MERGAKGEGHWSDLLTMSPGVLPGPGGPTPGHCGPEGAS